MNLLEVRTKFIQLSGHYELASTDGLYTDNGADFYINAGQDFLDLKKEFWKRKIPCYCKAYKLCWSEVAVLNFRYGGRTRFCLFSHKLHANGVKIGRTGHAFAIKKRSIKNINSASPEE